MLVFPNCKINLGLHVVKKRSDGYHDLETIFYPLPFYDALELIPHRPDQPEGFIKISLEGTDIYFAGSGLEIPGTPEDNIVIRACRRILQSKTVPSFQIHLHKKIPMGAGLGGGSANGALMLQLLNEVFQLNNTTNDLLALAKEIGSDCPFFILNKPVLATGRGEKMEKINLDLSGYSLLLIYPGIHIPTASSFSAIQPAPPKESLPKLISSPVAEWKNRLTNDFEKNVFAQYPQLADLKELLYQSGAAYASMTGSGSALYGLFPGTTDPGIRLPENTLSWFFHSI